MSLLLWEYYLDPAEWTSTPATPPPQTAGPANAGGANYRSIDSDYWDIREAALQRHIPIEVSSQTLTRNTTPGPTPNPADEVALAAALAQSQQVILDIQKRFVDHYNQAAIIMLLDLF